MDGLCVFCGEKSKHLKQHMKTCSARPAKRDCPKCGTNFRPWTDFQQVECNYCLGRTRIMCKYCKACRRAFFGTRWNCGRCRGVCTVCGRERLRLGSFVGSNCGKHIPKGPLKRVLQDVFWHCTGRRLVGGYSPDRENAHFCPLCGARTLRRTLCRVCRPRFLEIMPAALKRGLWLPEYLKGLDAALGCPAVGEPWTDDMYDIRGVRLKADKAAKWASFAET